MTTVNSQKIGTQKAPSKKSTTRKTATSTKSFSSEINLENLTKYFGYWDESHQWLKTFINEREDELKIGVEVGIAFGSNIKSLLEGTTIEKLFGVDCYSEDTWDLSGTLDVEKEFGSFDGLYEHVSHLLSSYGKRVQLIRMTSEEASKKFKNESLDFVFIDGDHFDIENDVNYWEPKIRDGGYLMGHDWKHPNFGNITSFLMDYYDEDELVGIDGPVHIWYVQKGAFM
jgi:hypothetical protein